MGRVRRSIRPSGNIDNHIANVLRGFDHFMRRQQAAASGP